MQALGGTQSLEKMVQTMGRANGNGMKVLVANGFSQVVVLSTEEDFFTMKTYFKFIEELVKKIGGTGSIADALSSASCYSKYADISLSSRPIGGRSLGLGAAGPGHARA